jgi:hypothetical protein
MVERVILFLERIADYRLWNCQCRPIFSCRDLTPVAEPIESGLWYPEPLDNLNGRQDLTLVPPFRLALVSYVCST